MLADLCANGSLHDVELRISQRPWEIGVCQDEMGCLCVIPRMSTRKHLLLPPPSLHGATACSAYAVASRHVWLLARVWTHDNRPWRGCRCYSGVGTWRHVNSTLY